METPEADHKTSSIDMEAVHDDTNEAGVDVETALSTVGTETWKVHDEIFVRASPSVVFDVLSDLRTYGHWWMLMRVVALGETRLKPGTRWRFEGGQPGGRISSWTVEVLTVVRPERIEMAYVEGDLVGRVAWELHSAPEGTTVAYVYRGVRAINPASAATFARYGTKLHSMAMQMDALAGLSRYVLGEEPDEQWRKDVSTRVADGIRRLDED